MRTIFINGKFTAQRTTGVQRAAGCIVAALDRLLPTMAGASAVRWVLLCPPRAVLPTLQRIEVRTIGFSNLALHLWEQLVLPWCARGSLLINLAGAAPLVKRAQVCTFHDAAVFDFPEAHTSLFGAWYRFLFRRVARRARLLLTVSEFSKTRLVAALGIAPAKVAVIPESGEHMVDVRADEGSLQRLGLIARTYFVAVGSSNPVKNLRVLEEAVAALPIRFDSRLVVVGGGNTAVFANALLPGDQRPAEVDPRILRAGAVSDAELKALYASALGLIFPSVYEGFGLPPLEAMACGCPVAASNAASIPEVCGDAALYFDPHSSEEVAVTMMRMVDEPDLRERLRTSGAARSAHFSWDAAAKALVERLITDGFIPPTAA